MRQVPRDRQPRRRGRSRNLCRSDGRRTQGPQPRGTACRLPAGLPGDRQRANERLGARHLAGRPALSGPDPLANSGGSRSGHPAPRVGDDQQTLCRVAPARARRRPARPGPAPALSRPRREGRREGALSPAGRFGHGPRAPGPPAGGPFPGHRRARSRPPHRLRAGKHGVGFLWRGHRPRHHHARGRPLGPGHRPADSRRLAAQSADPLRRRRALANSPGPHAARRARADSSGLSPRPSTR